MELEEFITNVAEASHGTQGDPLVREEVEQVVMVALARLNDPAVDTKTLLPDLVPRAAIEEALRTN